LRLLAAAYEAKIPLHWLVADLLDVQQAEFAVDFPFSAELLLHGVQLGVDFL